MKSICKKLICLTLALLMLATVAPMNAVASSVWDDNWPPYEPHLYPCVWSPEPVVVPATCTEQGTETYYCQFGCVSEITIPATGHDFQNGVCEYCGEADPSKAVLTGSLRLTCENARVQLLDGDTAVYTGTITGETYRFDGVTPGAYTLKVTCEGGVPREYPITLAAGENTQDAALSRPGDVTGDGIANIVDVARIYAHIKGSSLLESYAAACADVNGDGEVNILDTAMAYSRTKG